MVAPTDWMYRTMSILEMEGRIPHAGFSTSYKEFVFKIEKADKRRIIEIKVIYNEKDDE